MLINGDEEICSPGWRSTITSFAADQDVVFSFEGGGTDGTLRLATSGIGSAYLTVQGKSSHAGARPEGGVNALYELSHQLLQMKDLSKPEQGLKLNWTVSQGRHQPQRDPGRGHGPGRRACAQGRRFRRAAEGAAGARSRTSLLPDSKVELKFEVRRPPLEANDASRRVAAHGKTIYEEIGLPLKVDEKATGGGTDAAFAALKTNGAVVEGMGLSGLRRALQRCRICADRQHRAAALSDHAHDHGPVHRQAEIVVALPSPLVGEGGAKRRMRGPHAFKSSRPTRGQPLTRSPLIAASHPLPQGERVQRQPSPPA